jgi:hypothetical protein
MFSLFRKRNPRAVQDILDFVSIQSFPGALSAIDLRNARLEEIERNFIHLRPESTRLFEDPYDYRGGLAVVSGVQRGRTFAAILYCVMGYMECIESPSLSMYREDPVTDLEFVPLNAPGWHYETVEWDRRFFHSASIVNRFSQVDFRDVYLRLLAPAQIDGAFLSCLEHMTMLSNPLVVFNASNISSISSLIHKNPTFYEFLIAQTAADRRHVVTVNGSADVAIFQIYDSLDNVYLMQTTSFQAAIHELENVAGEDKFGGF